MNRQFNNSPISVTRSLSIAIMLAVTHGFAGDWPGWLGPARDGHAAAGSVVPKSLPLDPQRVWSLKIGDGHAPPVIAGDKVFYLDTQEGKEVAHAIDKNTGREIWRAPLDDGFKNGQTKPGPRAAPLVDGDRVYVQSCLGELRCLAVADGQLKWRVNFTKEFHAEVPAEKGLAKGAQRHGFTAAPWVDGDRLIALVGDTNGAGMVCFDKFTGKVLWQSLNDRAANAAPITALIAGSEPKQVVAFTVEGLIGVNLQTGELLWRIPLTTTHGRHVTTPIIDGSIVMVASKENSLMGVELAPEPVVTKPGSPKWKASIKWQTKNHLVNFSSLVAVGGYVYGLGPNKNLFCVETKTGKPMWSQEGFTLKPAENAHLAIIVLGENLLILTETGELVLVAAEPKEFKELGRAQVCRANWCNPAYADGKLFFRDDRELICVDLLP